MLFDSWYAIWRIVIIAIISYVVLTAVVRISGKRTLSKMSAFDLVVTVALGSTLATVILSKDVTLADGTTAFVMLCLLQFVTSWLFIRSHTLEKAAKASPSLMLYQQVYYREKMDEVHVTETDILSAIRKHGRHWGEVEAVVLEVDGSLSVIPKSSDQDAQVILKDVRPNPFEATDTPTA